MKFVASLFVIVEEEEDRARQLNEPKLLSREEDERGRLYRATYSLQITPVMFGDLGTTFSQGRSQMGAWGHCPPPHDLALPPHADLGNF